MIETNKLPFPEIREIGERSSAGIFIYNLADKRLLYVNRALITILEISKRLLLEDPDVVLHSVEEADRDYLKVRFSEMLQTGSVEDVQIRLSTSGPYKYLSFNLYMTTDKTSVVGFISDVSKFKQHEEYLINFGARKDSLLDAVSQNLSTPLNLSKNTIGLIEQAIAEQKYDLLREHVSVIREVTSESIGIINKFLQEEHLESPNIDPKANRFDVISKILIVLEKLKEANPRKQFRWKSKLRHLMINADEVKFFQIVHNLLSNSVKFTTPDGLIEVSVRENKRDVEIIVSDDGIGIPDAIKPFLFEKNTRAARPGLRGEISNGIGLYVVYKLTALMNGRISFESKENDGSSFSLVLPKG